MPIEEIEPRSLAIFRAMAGGLADSYIGETLLPALKCASHAESASLKDIRAAFSNPYRCLLAFYLHYAFAKRGRDREELTDTTSLALMRTAREDQADDLLSQPDGSLLWSNFEKICQEKRRKCVEQLNRGLIAGILELAQEIYRIDHTGSIAGWVLRGVLQTTHIEPQFLRIVDIRGVGPKTTSTFLRDMAFLYGMEDQLAHADRLYVQPVDRWIRLAASEVVQEFAENDAADWIVAGKLAKYTRKAGVSGIRFNMGASYFGTREVRDPARYSSSIMALAEGQSNLSNLGVPRPTSAHLG